MTVKPLNLSILIGDMGKSSPATPRSQQNSNNKKSRIPLATSQNCTGSAPSKGVTTFRQWADPPPPPARSRNAERNNTKEKKRTGSADPRFRRSLENTKANIHTEPVVIAESKKHSSSVSDLTSVSDIKEKLNEYPHTLKADLKTDSVEFLKNPKQRNFESTNEIIKQHFQEDLPICVQHMIDSKYDFDLDSFGTINKEEILLNNTSNSLATTQTESKYSQTDLYTAEYEKNETYEMPIEPLKTKEKHEDITHFLSTSNYDEEQSRYLDGIVLNRTRSIATVFELEPAVKVKSENKRKFGSVSRIFLQFNYWAYFEFWAAFTFLLIILMFGWYYLVPYLNNVLCMWLYPEPELTASDYFRKSLSEILSSTADTIYGILTTPANRRLS